MKPKILIVRDANGHKCQERVIDMASDPKDTEDRLVKIKNLHPSGAFGIDLASYIKRGLRLSEEPDESA